MGSLRLFLAISVLIGHAKPIGSLRFMPDATAVWLFFIISGFYMQMIVSGKYGSRVWTFYTNRILRLYPVYFIAAIIALFAVNDLSARLAASTFNLYWSTIIANATLFGGDLLFYFGHDGRLLVPPAWSVGLELWFYLLVPLLARSNVIGLLICSAASGLLALYMEAAHPWSSYFFFPANFYLFGVGMMAYRSMMLLSESLPHWPTIARAVAAVGLALLALRPLIPGFRNYSLAHEAVLAICLPFIFEATRRLNWDRVIGNLSYSCYLLHEPVMNFLGPRPSGVATLLITLPLAVAVFVLVERPIDRWRQKRASGCVVRALAIPLVSSIGDRTAQACSTHHKAQRYGPSDVITKDTA